MLDQQKFIEEEKDCASMLGLTLKEYRQSLKNVKVHKQNMESDKNRKYDNSILKTLGLTEKDLKRRRV